MKSNMESNIEFLADSEQKFISALVNTQMIDAFEELNMDGAINAFLPYSQFIRDAVLKDPAGSDFRGASFSRAYEKLGFLIGKSEKLGEYLKNHPWMSISSRGFGRTDSVAFLEAHLNLEVDYKSLFENNNMLHVQSKIKKLLLTDIALHSSLILANFGQKEECNLHQYKFDDGKLSYIYQIEPYTIAKTGLTLDHSV